MKMMSSSRLDPGTPKAAELFEDVWKHLGELHQNAVQELEAKVSKLKKERCLDAQKLEVFYNRNQQLKEQNKALQDTISFLEERLRPSECDGCSTLKEDLKNSQDQNLHLLTKLKNERKSLEDENRKLQTELQKARMSRSPLQPASSPEQEEGVIPDSPVLHSSLPVANRLRKPRHSNRSQRVRYAETHFSSNKSLLSEPVDAAETVRRAEVLVPNTCEYDPPDNVNLQSEEVVAETCVVELFNKPQLNPEAAAAQPRLKSPQENDATLKPPRCLRPPLAVVLSPDSTTDRSPSLLPRVQRFSQEASTHKTKRKKEECEPEGQEDNKPGKREDEIRETASSFHRQSFKEPPNKKSAQRSHASSASPTSVCDAARRAKPLQERSGSRGPQRGKGRECSEPKHRAEPTWSMDPALAVSMYDAEEAQPRDEEQHHGELADTDCTWISHSVLQRSAGLGQKANDSLDMLFDTTACGEYKSFNGSQRGQSQLSEEEEEQEEDPEDHEASLRQRNGNKAQGPTFAHVAVIRKKDERRKLKGTTCKECEIYYAHLPEEEKQKRLSACSRHRFLYIPPSTPENFWEVGFPSTQTCIKRGYIKEDKNPRARPRRRQPLNALFSPKATQEEP
ncbi:DNA endonuclease RBBP8 isoform X1 [Takifugu flavidus]|uniref:DNA endonuclease RBBP8 isoform X1 n=1 Tax=Takifugu flavidus TaxID=433684 RepID=UPI002544221D|nr:DNA endonuclease RBBP8 isoform X1 [Takifugu flavidus]